MISEFIWLELVKKNTNYLSCSCSLPDPDPYSDEDMIICGDVSCVFDANNDNSIIKIRLFDNFKELCVGDTYQRKDFVQTIILVLNMKYGINIQNAHVELSDCWGTYSGNLDFIDEVIRGVD